MSNVRRCCVAGLMATSVLVVERAARADDIKQACVAAYDETQALRDAGKLLQAREKALACSAPACSAFIVKECTIWRGEIDVNMPTVVFAAQDTSGADTLDVRVMVDGRVFLEKLDVKALPLDPGEHVVRFELAGAAPIEQKVLLRQGEKNRNVLATFKLGPVAPVAPDVPPPSMPATPPSTSGVRTVGFVLGAVGVAGLAVGVAAGVVAIGDKNGAKCNAAGVCAADSSGLLAGLRTAAHVSTAGFVSGGVLAAAGITMIVVGSVKVTPAVGMNGASLMATGSFR